MPSLPTQPLPALGDEMPPDVMADYAARLGFSRPKVYATPSKSIILLCFGKGRQQFV
jgi:hypothetical protein